MAYNDVTCSGESSGCLTASTVQTWPWLSTTIAMVGLGITIAMVLGTTIAMLGLGSTIDIG